MALYGYARVSTIDQDLSIQEKLLREAGCDIIRSEKTTGNSLEDRNELDLLITFLRPGDTLVFTRVDRIARSARDLQNLVYLLKERGVTLKSIQQPIDTSTYIGKFFFDTLGLYSELETNISKERQLEGIAKAKDRGVYKGRKPSINRDEVYRLSIEEKMGATKIAKKLDISRSSVYRILNKKKE
jgi:DNA invertase Pin-like site-specific DNA recombinase